MTVFLDVFRGNNGYHILVKRGNYFFPFRLLQSRYLFKSGLEGGEVVGGEGGQKSLYFLIDGFL